VVAAEGFAAIVFGIAEAFTIHGSRLVLGLTTSAFFIVYGVGSALVARGLFRASTWSRGPTVFTQLLQLLLAYNFWDGSTKPVAIALGGTALVVLVCVFQKASTEALADNPAKDHPVL
jgi:hypothetical protein